MGVRGQENFLQKVFLPPKIFTCDSPPHSSKTFRKMGFATDIVACKTVFLPLLNFLKGCVGGMLYLRQSFLLSL